VFFNAKKEYDHTQVALHKNMLLYLVCYCDFCSLL